MLVTLIQKEIMHHILSVRFVALLLMCVLLIPLTLSINYRSYRQNLVDYQEAVKLANIEETTINTKMPLDPELEISKLFLKPELMSVFANGLGNALPSYLGVTRNGVTQGPPALVSAPLSYLLGHLDFLFIVRDRFQSTCITVYIRCSCWGARSRYSSDYLSKFPAARSLSVEQIDWRIPRVFVVPFLVSLLFGLLVLVWQGFPLG